MLDYQRAKPISSRPAALISAAGAFGLLSIVHALMGIGMVLVHFSPAAIAAGAAAMLLGAVGLALTLLARGRTTISPRLLSATLLINIIPAATGAAAIVVAVNYAG